MQIDTKVHAGIAALIYPMANAVIFGSGLITVLTLPPLNANAMTWIPVIAVTSFVLAAPVAWLIAPSCDDVTGFSARRSSVDNWASVG